MNVDELRELSSEDLLEKLEEVSEEFFNLRFQNATGQLENFAQIKLIKRDVARIRTIVRERELGMEIEPKPAKQPKAKAKDKDKDKDKDKPRKERSRKADDEAGED